MMKHVQVNEIAADISVQKTGSVILRADTVSAKPRSTFSAPEESSSALNGSVWVIDDDMAVLALLRSVFGREGYEVQQSSSVAEALKKMPGAANISLVILDFNIPGGSGLDVLRKLRQTSEAPVVMISNIKRPELVAQAFELGANDFIEKPFNPRLLLVRARRLIE